VDFVFFFEDFSFHVEEGDSVEAGHIHGDVAGVFGVGQTQTATLASPLPEGRGFWHHVCVRLGQEHLWLRNRQLVPSRG